MFIILWLNLHYVFSTIVKLNFRKVLHFPGKLSYELWQIFLVFALLVIYGIGFYNLFNLIIFATYIIFHFCSNSDSIAVYLTFISSKKSISWAIFGASLTSTDIFDRNYIFLLIYVTMETCNIEMCF